MLQNSFDSRRPAKVIRRYEAQGEALGPVRSVLLASRELYWSRHILWHLFVRDFVAGFRQKLLGYLWIVLVPLLGIASFVFMQLTGILNPGDTAIPYPIYVFVGTTIWGVFVNALTAVANGLINNTDLVMRTNIPKIGLAITGLASLFYNLLVNLFVLVLLMVVFGRMPSAWALLYPLAVLPIIMLGVGIGLMLSVIGAVARDVTGMFITLINLLMYVTPVVYTADFQNLTLQRIVRWNPLTYLVDTPRSLFVLGTVPDAWGYLFATVFSILVLWLGVHAFYLIKDKVAERL
ncbi:sugar ABC transporter permease [Rhizobium leguminosarum bv. viciae]|uniref:Transport permease protein n=1 Tax=Rhizobium leguminosarum bv. viciae TaxID=387 RepID=A0A8I2GY66_RHILV|nr:ABC transporter permease [Rhizobium leguminosarum]NKM50171.1 sugar ABC transporter permease [Rhizobium leguminosarum bv. viciae]